MHADSPIHRNIIDICGESSAEKEIRQFNGYLWSLSYPENYPINIKCSCNMSVGPDEQILLNFIDSGMEKSCEPDLLEYSVPNVSWGKGVHLCNFSLGQNIHTGLSSIVLNFNSGSGNLSRGFWLKYDGITRLGGKSTVTTKCFVVKGSNDPDVTKEPDIEVKIKKIDPSDDNKTIMIGGILIVVLLIVTVIVVLIAYQFRR